jgi:TonB-linked SusC/RagA family outer membrane protein
MTQLPILFRVFASSRLRVFALACALPLASWGQQIVSGTVTDEDNIQLPGAAIVVQNTTRGTTTDFDGKYQIQANEGDTLIFTYVGYTTQLVTVGSSTTINVQMQISGQLEEVVVVGYGTQSRRSVVGSVDVIDSSTISNLRATSIGQALQGTVAGVNVINSGGVPGSNPVIRIRGISSVNANAAPLFVVDGVPYNGNLNNISQEQIESISVLRDASATTIYGSRGSNGIVLITTKSGKEGKEPSITFKTQKGITSTAVDLHDLLELDDWTKLNWEAKKNRALYVDELSDSDARAFATNNLIGDLAYNPYDESMPVNTMGELIGEASWDTDWADEILRNTGVFENHSLSVDGGGKISSYYFNLDYLKEDGQVKTTDFERISFRTNLRTRIKDFISTGVNIGYTDSNQNVPDQSGTGFQSAIQWIYVVPNYYPIHQRDENGNYVLDSKGNRIFDYGDRGLTVNGARPIYQGENVAGALVNYDYKNKRSNFTGVGFIDLEINSDFNFRTTLSYERYLYDYYEYIHNEFGFASNVDGRIEQDRNITTTLNTNYALTYQKDYGLHRIDATALYESYMFTLDELGAQGTGFLPNVSVLNGSTVPEDVSGSIDEERIISYLGRISYNYDEKYYLEGSFRRDGSTRFEKSVRWGNFFSIGGSWILSAENFMSDSSFVNYLKLKGSYGEGGNNRGIGFFPYQQLFTVGWNQLDTTGVLSQTIVDPNLTWEKTSSTNFGVEFSLFNNKFSGEIEYFSRESVDLIFDKPLAISTGNDEITTNIGAIKNLGVDVQFDNVIINNKNWSWNTSLNFSFLDNSLTKLSQDEIISGSKKWQVGKSIYDFFIREYAGVDPDDGYAMWYMDVLDGDGNPTGERTTTKEYGDATRYYQDKKSIPDITGGFSSTINHKNFDFNMLFNFSIGSYVLDGVYQGLMSGFSSNGRQGHPDLLKRWQKPGDVTDVPLVLNSQNDFNQRSDRFLFKNDYVRLKAISLGYTLDKSISNDLNIESIRIYFQGDNLFTYQTHKGIDPEQSDNTVGDSSALSGLTNNRSYQTKNIAFGLDIKF